MSDTQLLAMAQEALDRDHATIVHLQDQLAEAKEALNVARKHTSSQIDKDMDAIRHLEHCQQQHRNETRDFNTKIKILRYALEKIRDEDYRGNRHSSHFIALRALREAE